MFVGYRRSSTSEQVAGFEAQELQLSATGCTRIFGEMTSSVAQRDELVAALDFVREGDTLWKSSDGICGAERTDSLGTTFSTAIVSQYPDQMVIAVSNTSWGAMKVGQHYPFVLSINGSAQRLDGIAINGAAPPNDHTLVSKIDLKVGLDAMSKHRPFSVSLDDRPLVQDAKVPLGAVAWLIACGVGSDDPFRSR